MRLCNDDGDSWIWIMWMLVSWMLDVDVGYDFFVGYMLGWSLVVVRNSGMSHIQNTTNMGMMVVWYL